MSTEPSNAPRKRPRTDTADPTATASHRSQIIVQPCAPFQPETDSHDDESTEYKLALLASLHPDCDQTYLLEALLAANGSIGVASENLAPTVTIKESKASFSPPPPLGDVDKSSPRSPLPLKSLKRPTPSTVGVQSSLASYYANTRNNHSSTGVSLDDAKVKRTKLLTRKGRTLHLYAPADVEAHTPCSIIHNFLPTDEADALLRELVAEAPTFQRATFKLFEREVQSPHTMCFYVDTLDEAERQKTDYSYAGEYLKV